MTINIKGNVYSETVSTVCEQINIVKEMSSIFA